MEFLIYISVHRLEQIKAETLWGFCVVHVQSSVIHLNSVQTASNKPATRNLQRNHCAPTQMRHIRLYQRGLDTCQLTAASR